jgi:PAS domain S-box-containing protein
MPAKNQREEPGNPAAPDQPRQTLSLHETKYQLLVENTGDVIVVLEWDGTIHYLSPSVERILGYQPQDMVGKRIFEFIHPDDRSSLSSILSNNPQRSDAVQLVEIRFRHPDDSWHVLECVSRNLPVDSELVGIIIDLRDVTGRQQADEALRYSQERYILAQRVANIGSWDWDVQTGKLRWSDTIEPMFGFAPGKFGATYEAFLDSVHPEDRQYVVDSVNACVEAGADYDIEHRIVWPDGTVRWVSETGDVFRDGRGKAIRMLGVVQDITERKRAEKALREYQQQLEDQNLSLLKLSQAVEQSANIVIITDVDGNIEYVNPRFVEITGYTAEEVLGRNPRILKSGEQTDGYYQELWETILSGQEWYGEFHNRRKDGSLYWEQVTIAPVYNAVGRMAHFVAVKEDVTARKQAEEALRRYADRLKALHEIDQTVVTTHSEEAIAQVALRHMRRLIPCLRASVAVLDWQTNEMSLLAVSADGETRLGKGWHSSLESVWFARDLELDQMQVVEDILALPLSSPLIKILQDEGVRTYVILPIVSEGNTMGSLNLGMADPGEMSASLLDIAREIVAELAIGLHHTRLHQQVQQHAAELERQVARRTVALRASEARFRAIFEGAGIGMALVDVDGRFVESNPALQEILGRSAQELGGTSFIEIVHPDDVAADTRLYAELMAGKQNDDKYRVERRYIRKDGRLRWGNLTVSLVQTGESQYATVMIEDVTERKQVQQALIQSEKLAITGKLAASLAHEINNPLQSVIGCLGLAEESLAEGEEGADELLQIAMEELERAAGIVAQLRDLNRPPKPEERKLTDVNALLEQVLILTKKQCQQRQVEVSLETANNLPQLMLVPDRMQQVFLNLILNALDAMPEGGRLQMITHDTPEPVGVCILFVDSGRGIASDVVPRVFDPFYTTKPEGLGLGLYVTRNIVEEHGGYVEVESQVEEGTTFKVWLPA